MARRVGKKMRPCNTPKVANPMKETKIFLMISLVLNASSSTPRKETKKNSSDDVNEFLSSLDEINAPEVNLPITYNESKEVEQEKQK